MSTLKLDPAIAAARRAARLTQIPIAPIAAPVATTEPAKRSMSQLLKLVRGRWPEMFDPVAAPKPLKIGVHTDLKAELGFSYREVRLLLQQWCHRRCYLAVLVAGAPRYGLDGVPDGEVTEKQAAVAAAELVRRGKNCMPHAAKMANRAARRGALLASEPSGNTNTPADPENAQEAQQ